DEAEGIVVRTTFGLLESTDDGATWRWVCEQAVTTQLTARLYQMGPAPQHVLYAATNQGISISRDDACNWEPAGGILTKAFTPDVFADSAQGSQRVLVLATPVADAAIVPSGVYRSTDAGQTWESTPLFADDMGGLLGGVEIAASDPQTIYMTMKRTQPLRPFLVRSTDGGANWTKIDLGSVASGLEVLLIAVDPHDANKVFLRAID